MLETCTSRGFKVADADVERGGAHGAGSEVAVSLEVHGRAAVTGLAADLNEIDAVHAVRAGDVNEISTSDAGRRDVARPRPKGGLYLGPV